MTKINVWRDGSGRTTKYVVNGVEVSEEAGERAVELLQEIRRAESEIGLLVDKALVAAEGELPAMAAD